MLVIDARMLGASGIGTVIRNLIPHLSKAFKTTLLTNPQLLETWNIPGNYKVIPTTSSIYSIKEQLELPSRIPRCEIFFSPHFPTPLLPIRAKKRVTTIHDCYHLDHLNDFSRKEQCYAKLMYRHSGFRSTLITDSKFSHERIKHHLNRDATVIYPGIHLPEPLFLDRVKQKYALPDEYILYLGNLKKHKNILGLIAAHKLMKHQIPLVIFGSSEMRHHLPLSDHDNVLIKGFADQDDLPALYKLAKVFAFPSLYEGFGLPPLEAMAMGCPVLASTAASLPEVCGDAAYLSDPLSPSSISKGLDYLINHPKEYIKRGHIRAASFSWEKASEQYIACFHNK